MDWFNLGLNGFVIAAQGCLQLSFACSFTNKERKIWNFVVYLILLYFSNIAAVVLRMNDLVIGMELLTFYGVNRFILANSRPVSCVTTVLAVYVARLSFGIINSVEFLLFPYALGQTLLLYLLIVLAMIIAFALCLCCYRFITKRFSLRYNQQEPYIWMLLPPSLFFFAVELYIFNNHYGNVITGSYPMEIGKHFALFALQILGLGALFCSLYAYKRTCDGFQAQAALTALAQEIHAQKTYVAQAQMRYEQTQAFRHDIKNHLSVLNGLLKSGNQEQANDYLKKLEAVTGEMSFPIHTGNPVVDILLADKLELAHSNGIETEISLALPKPCQVDDFDWCVIFANALDNAIRACTQTDGRRFIRIIGERQGDFYMLGFENSYLSETSCVVGIGLSNVKAVSKKYNGAMTIEKTDTFRLDVLLNISIQQNDSSIQNA